MAIITNEFASGMDQDSSKNKYDNKHYYDAENVRILTQDGVTSGALEDMMGTIERLDIDSGGALFIVGHCILRDNIIIFATRNPFDSHAGSYTDYILRIPIEDIENLTGTNVKTISLNYVHDPSPGNVIYSGQLSFSKGSPIAAIPRWETENIQKVYWVDGYNPFRYLNTVYNEDTNDLANLPEDRLEVTGNIELSIPELDDIGTGSLRAGRVQYAYQLYTLNGSETVFSPFSPLYDIYGSSTNAPNDVSVRGSEIDEDTGKSFKILIDIPSLQYTRIRVIAMQWTTLAGDPEIRIIDEADIDPAGGEISVFDSGQSLGSYTLEEVRLLQTTFAIPSVIETKDNFLFTGDIKLQSFDVDFDARAYRFCGSSSVSTNYNYNRIASIPQRGYAFVGEEGSLEGYTIRASDKATFYGVKGLTGTLIGDWTDIPEDADCICEFNRLSVQNHYNRYMYQSDGATVGGEGPNVSYTFSTLDIEPDESRSGVATSYDFWADNSSSNNPSNESYAAYSSPWNAGEFLGYHRDEIYRFGIVFFDDKGRSSFVKWIGDIRMPSHSTETANGVYSFRYTNDFSGGRAELLRVNFDVDISSISDQIASYQIVRVVRESTDRTVLAQGIANHPGDDSNGRCHVGWSDTTKSGSGATGNDRLLYQYHSPEISFNKNLELKANDFVQVVGIAGTGSNSFGEASATGTLNNLFKYTNWNPLDNPQRDGDSYGAVQGDEFYDDNFSDVELFRLVKQTDLDFSLGGFFEYSNKNDDLKTTKGIFALIKPENDTFDARLIDYDAGIRLINYRRDLYGTQYGGHSYTSRANNQYVAASTIYDKTDVSTKRVCGGDTFIGMFDCLYNTGTNEEARPVGEDPDVLVFIVETSINLALRIDDGYCRQRFTGDEMQFLHDEAGIYADDNIESGTPSFILYQDEDLYRYNTVYSKTNTAKIFVPKPFDWVALEDFDTRVYASDQKINGEIADSWLKFRTDSFIELDPQYGPVTALKKVNTRLVFFQPQAFGTISVNERALLQTATQAQLSLGVGDVLERYDYAKTDVGCSHWRHLVLTPNALYWVDAINQSMFMFTKGPEEISIMKGLHSWFNDNIVERKDMSTTLGESMHLFYDPEFREVYVVDNNSNWGLIWNELTNGFVCRTDNQPWYVINYLEKVLGTTNLRQFHRHNDFAGSRGHIYGSYREISLTLLINPSQHDIAIFNNFEWLTECFDDDFALGLIDQRLTWQELRMWNDYQHTGIIPLVVGDNVKRRMRKWRFTIPRARFARNGFSSLPDSERYARMRDTHMFARFSYTNDTADQKFTIHDILTSVTISNT